jgi:hypothetical protein
MRRFSFNRFATHDGYSHTCSCTSSCQSPFEAWCFNSDTKKNNIVIFLVVRFDFIFKPLKIMIVEIIHMNGCSFYISSFLNRLKQKPILQFLMVTYQKTDLATLGVDWINSPLFLFECRELYFFVRGRQKTKKNFSNF